MFEFVNTADKYEGFGGEGGEIVIAPDAQYFLFSIGYIYLEPEDSSYTSSLRQALCYMTGTSHLLRAV